ncbi:Zinc finger protein [Plecturocebus cupreus]
MQWEAAVELGQPRSRKPERGATTTFPYPDTGACTRSCLRLECQGVNMTHCSLDFLGPSDSLASASHVAETTGMHHHTWLIFLFFVETGSHYVAQASLELLDSSNTPTCLPECWDYRCEPPYPVKKRRFLKRQGLTMLPRPLSNSQAKAILPPQSPKVLGFTEAEFCHVAQAGLKLLGSSNPPALASQGSQKLLSAVGDGATNLGNPASSRNPVATSTASRATPPSRSSVFPSAKWDSPTSPSSFVRESGTLRRSKITRDNTRWGGAAAPRTPTLEPTPQHPAQRRRAGVPGFTVFRRMGSRKWRMTARVSRLVSPLTGVPFTSSSTSPGLGALPETTQQVPPPESSRSRPR